MPYVVEALFWTGAAESTEASFPHPVPSHGAEALLQVWQGALTTRALLIEQRFSTGMGQLRRPGRCPPLLPAPRVLLGCHSGRSRILSLAPAPVQWFRDSVQEERQAIRTKRSTSLPEGTDFTWNRVWKCHVEGCCPKQ